MSAALLWIILPLIFAGVLWVFRSYSKFTMFLGVFLSVFFAILALTIKIDFTYLFGNIVFKIEPEMNLLGRAFVLNDSDRAIIFLLYGITAFWLLLGTLFDSLPAYAGYGLGLVAFLVAGLGAEPFLYAPLFIAMGVFVSVPMLIRLPKRSGRGDVFYLAFMTLAIPILLLASWSAASVQSNPLDIELTQRTAVLFFVGFSLLLSAFPFFIWIPKVAEQFRPARVYFLLSVFPVGAFLIFSEFLVAYPWLRNAAFLFDALNISGLVLIVVGGVWTAFQNDASRMMGYGVVIENGFLFLALGSGIESGLPLMALLILPRLFGLAVWGAAAAILGDRGTDLSFAKLNGLLWQYPVVMFGLLFSYFSIGGLPLLGGFPAKVLLIREIVTKREFLDVFWILVGEMGFIIGGLRLLGTLIGERQGKKMKINENWIELVFLVAGVLGLFIIGIAPSIGFDGLLEFFQSVNYLQF